MATIVKLHHVQITIPQGAEEQGRYFYCHVLGLQEIEKPDSLKARGGFWLQIGDRQIHIGTENGVERQATRAHIAYEVDDLEAWRAILQHNGCTILEGIPIPGYQRFETRDPFGNRLELIQAENI
ncbi:MAG TPA: VOC family protein [Dictyobacter sp.]|nr:VOC family protein [Dictyobacter sp.]